MTPLLYKRASPKFVSILSFIAVIAFLPLLLIAMYQSVQLITKAVGTPANIVVNTQVSLEPITTDFYHAFAQGGEEAGDMLGPVVNEVKALNPKIIRIDHIYDYYNVVSKNGNSISCNFNDLDKTIETILRVGAKPMLALSYMPKSIAKDGVIINPPNDWNDWALVVQKTIEHYSGKSGKNLSGVYYEVWNEPDLAQFGSWKIGGEKDYLTLYQYAAQGAAKTTGVNQFYFGGPATTGLYKNWITALAKSGYRIDFFSWHTYLADPKRYLTDQQNIISWLRDWPALITKQTIISEFGFTGDKSPLYATAYSAAHTAAVIRQLISGGPTYIFSFQLKDGPNQEAQGGWGILSHESNGTIKKPRYFLYSFIDEMIGKRIQVSGEGSWVTGFATTKGSTIRLLLVNFDANGSHVENVPVTFSKLSNGSYAYKQRFLNGETTQSTEVVTNGTITKKIYMPAQSVVILEVSR